MRVIVDLHAGGSPTETETLAAIRDGIAARPGGAERPTKPVLACVMAEPGALAPLMVAGEKVPAYAFPENAARALGKVAAYAELARPAAGAVLELRRSPCQRCPDGV